MVFDLSFFTLLQTGVRMMGQITSADILSALPKLTQNELEQINNAAQFLSKKQIKNIDEYEWLFDAIILELKVHGVNRYIGFTSFSETTHFKTFKRGADEVKNFFAEVYPNYKLRSQKVGISRVLIAALIRDMRSKEIPITLTTISKNIHRLPEVFELSFPNYIQSGLAHLIPKQMEYLANGRSSQ